MPRKLHTITVDEGQLVELLTAVEIQVDILNDTVTEDLFVSNLNNMDSVSFTRDEYKKMVASTDKRIDRLVNVQLLYSLLKDKVAAL